MSDTAAIMRTLMEFLRATLSSPGASIEFGVQFDNERGRWVASMAANHQVVTFPPGAGRQLVRTLRERATAATADLTDQLREGLGAPQFESVFREIERSCKIAMERNAADVRPEFFAHPTKEFEE